MEQKFHIRSEISIEEKLKECSFKLSAVPLELIEVSVDPLARRNECHKNVALKIKRDGGGQVVGWIWNHAGRLLFSCWHSVWLPPGENVPVDITPVVKKLSWNENEYDVVMTKRGKRYFTRFAGRNSYCQRYFCLTANARLKKLAAKMQRHFYRMDMATRSPSATGNYFGKSFEETWANWNMVA